METGCPSTPPIKMLFFIIFSSSIIILHKYVAPTFMVLFLLAMWSMIDCISSCDEPIAPACINSFRFLIKIGCVVSKWERSSTMVHQMSKGLCSSMEFLQRDDLSKNDCPFVTHQGFHRVQSRITSTKFLKNHRLPLIVCMVFSFSRVSSSTIWNIKDVFIKSTTWVFGWSVQETSRFNLFPSPYLCSFLLWHGSSLCRGPS